MSRHHGKHRVTILDVAALAGVSKSTAARVISGNGSTSAEASQRVTEAALKLGYHPNALAKAMVSGTSKTIGIVIPDIANPFFSTAVRGISDSARAAGYEVIIANSDNDAEIESRSINLLLEKQVDGIIVAPVFQEKSASIVHAAESGTPIILLDRRGGGAYAGPLVAINNVEASVSATNFLIDSGHKHIAIVSEAAESVEYLKDYDDDPTALRPSSQRLLGYLRAMTAGGLATDEGHIVRTSFDKNTTANRVSNFLRSDKDVSAIFSTDSVVSSGSFIALSKAAALQAHDISFLAFDDQEWTTMVSPTVSVVTQPRYQLGSIAATKLLERINLPARKVHDSLLGTELLIRESTTRQISH
ncbi:LacI family DNA-binding transcriptional regulator [Flaviflexus massiliensis]|uniref:LacI family DNA-binding transcriptional regulator n=1 Tax=Flaviflexus massiliensis TaxID=1522309 RepID=UPI0006D554C8|nr:LacI family DNA-binding transcriptional regulator [Flaviflexus massiliensis]